MYKEIIEESKGKGPLLNQKTWTHLWVRACAATFETKESNYLHMHQTHSQVQEEKHTLKKANEKPNKKYKL